MTGDTVFENVVKHSKKVPNKVISIRVELEALDKFNALCKKKSISKAKIFSWAIEQAIKKMEAE